MKISGIKYISIVLLTLHVCCSFNKTPHDFSRINVAWQYYNLNTDSSNALLQSDKPLPAAIKYTSFLPFISSPIIEKGALIVMKKSGQLKKYKNKKILWVHNHDKQKQTKNLYCNGGISFDNGIIFVNYGTNIIKAISASNGNLIWEVELNDVVRSFPLVIGDKLIVQANSNSIYAINKKNGLVIYYHSRNNQSIKKLFITSPLKYKNTIILQHNFGISFIDLNSGIEENFHEYKNYPQQDNKILGVFQIKLIGKSLLYYDLNGYLSRLDLEKKKIVWHKLHKINRPLLVKNNYIFALDEKDHLVKIDYLNSNLIWTKDISNVVQKKHQKCSWSYPISYSNKIYLWNNSGFILILDEISGQKISYTKNKLQNIHLPPASIKK